MEQTMFLSIKSQEYEVLTWLNVDNCAIKNITHQCSHAELKYSIPSLKANNVYQRYKSSLKNVTISI